MVKKLLFKGLIFTAIACSGLYAYDRYMFYNRENNLRALAEELATVDKVKYISLGNSIGERLHIGYNNKDEMANLCINGNDIYVIREQLRAMETMLTSDHVVLVNISFFAPHYLTSRLPNDLKQNMVMFYYTLPFSAMRPWNMGQALKNKIFVVSRLKNFDKTMKELISGKPKQPQNQPEEEEGGWELTAEDAQIDTARELHRGKLFSEEMNASLKYAPDLPQQFQDAIKDMQEICRRKKCRLVFYSMPVHGKFQTGYGQQKADTLKEYLSNFMQQQKAEYYFHYDDSLFLRHGNLFKDGNHLNEKGAAKFANILFKELSRSEASK